MSINEIYYPIQISRIDKNGKTLYIAFYPDFGTGFRSVGNTDVEALKGLAFVRNDIIRHFIKTGQDYPKSTALKFDE